MWVKSVVHTKKKCNDNSVQFYNCELMKQKIHKFAEDDTYDHLKPKEIYKMALESFTKIIIPKKFKKSLPQHIRYVRFRKNNHKKTQPSVHQQQNLIGE